MRSYLLAGTCIALSFPTFTSAQSADATSEINYPVVEGALELELGNDWFFRSSDSDNELNDLTANAALGLAVHFNPHLTLNVGLTFEPVLDPHPGASRTFGDLGLYADTLNVQGNFGNFSLTAGKYSPGFGTAWDITPGVYGTDLAGDYELSEMLGLGASYSFDGTPFGTIALGVNLFAVDTTVLSDSVFTRRGRTVLADGGAANTERLDNVSLTLDGSEIADLPGFSWHLGYRHLRPGQGDAWAENGFVAGIAKEFALEDDLSLTFNGEVAILTNAFASEDDIAYTTLGVALAKNNWHGEVAGTLRRTSFAAGDSQNDLLLQASAGYEWDNGIDLSLGYAYARDADADTHSVGMRLTKTFEFTTR